MLLLSHLGGPLPPCQRRRRISATLSGVASNRYRTTLRIPHKVEPVTRIAPFYSAGFGTSRSWHRRLISASNRFEAATLRHFVQTPLEV